MKQADEQALEALLITWKVVSVDPRSAEALGAFEEEALTEEDAARFCQRGANSDSIHWSHATVVLCRPPLGIRRTGVT